MLPEAWIFLTCEGYSQSVYHESTKTSWLLRILSLVGIRSHLVASDVSLKKNQTTRQTQTSKKMILPNFEKVLSALDFFTYQVKYTGYL